ncbi:MAG: FAD-dependent monooxygenase [Acidimicrobiales bacterium]
MGHDHPSPVVIIGGGVAGLTAAGRLHRAGIAAIVVEDSWLEGPASISRLRRSCQRHSTWET